MVLGVGRATVGVGECTHVGMCYRCRPETAEAFTTFLMTTLLQTAGKCTVDG